MARAEFEVRLGYTPAKRTVQEEITVLPVLASDDTPVAFDWRTDSPLGNVVTAIKNQEQCGGCWAFSAVEGVESASAIAGNKLVELSPQQLIDCANGTAQCHNEHCTGGNYLCTGDYLESTGIETEVHFHCRASCLVSSYWVLRPASREHWGHFFIAMIDMACVSARC